MSKENGNGGVDVPAEFTSSIGSISWPPESTNNRRLKGVYPLVIDSPRQLIRFIEDFDSLTFHTDATRITGRLVATLDSLYNLPDGNCIETVVPLQDCGVQELSDCALVYIGSNLPTRKSPEDIFELQHQRASEIFQTPSARSKSLPSGFQIRLLSQEDRANPEILAMYFKLYSLFGWSEEQVIIMLSSTNNLIFAATDPHGLIVSSALAESGTMIFSREDQPISLSLVEITEAATLMDHRGNGLYQHVSDAILYYLAQTELPPHLVFGELNLDAPGVLKVAARQGRIPALTTAQQFKIPHAWCLEQHVEISQGDNSQRRPDYPYNNLMVAYLPQKLLLKKYGKPKTG